jgi:hypothetical protein
MRGYLPQVRQIAHGSDTLNDIVSCAIVQLCKEGDLCADLGVILKLLINALWIIWIERYHFEFMPIMAFSFNLYTNTREILTFSLNLFLHKEKN